MQKFFVVFLVLFIPALVFAQVPIPVDPDQSHSVEPKVIPPPPKEVVPDTHQAPSPKDPLPDPPEPVIPDRQLEPSSKVDPVTPPRPYRPDTHGTPVSKEEEEDPVAHGEPKSIQDRINMAANGETILVKPGVYFENISIVGKNIILKSTHGAETTSIDCFHMGTVVKFVSGANGVLDGFTIRKGLGTNGGGIKIIDCSPKITNCIITDNEATSAGAGLYIRNSSTIMTNNTIMFNKALSQGGGVFIKNAVPTLTNNSIMENEAVMGGGLASVNASPEVINTILWEDVAIQGPEIMLKGSASQGVLAISYSDVEGGLAAVHADPGSMLVWGAGMIDADPCFCDCSCGDLHIRCVSPCKDGGSTMAPHLPDRDREGDPRVAHLTVDIGADEFYPRLYYMGKAVPGETIHLKFVNEPNAAPVLLYHGTGVLDPPLYTHYGNWYLEFPLLQLWVLGAIPADGVLVLPANIPLGYFGEVPLQAYMDGMLSNLLVIDIK